MDSVSWTPVSTDIYSPEVLVPVAAQTLEPRS